MQSTRKLCRIGLLAAFSLAVAAPAFADDGDGAKNTKKTTTTTQRQKAKSEKSKAGSAMDKDTTSQYPPTQVPGSGY